MLFGSASLLGWLGMVAVARADAEENVGRPIDRETSNSSIRVESLEGWSLITLKRVYFGSEECELNSEEKTVLNVVASRVSRAARSVIELRGYTDGVESAQPGTELGTIRSQKIARYLVAHGVSSDRILVVVINATSDEETSTNAEHRRVDLRVFNPVASGDALPGT